ncbi:MAG: hypothetical protein A2W11_14415 [Ignavibacteria bacterium RBG_16_35_7]|nr:MAG: hypothetical protein A2W11_14415 [Ignavibacteria bacterium RBG_16_35_7]
MQDIIYGLVCAVIDGDTFIINVTEKSDTNQHNYNKWERIRIANIDPSELKTPGGYRDKVKLESTIQGKEVSCSVQSRDGFGRVVAEVELL